MCAYLIRWSCMFCLTCGSFLASTAFFILRGPIFVYTYGGPKCIRFLCQWGYSSIGNRHSRLSSFGTSNFFEKNLCTRTGIFFIRYLGSSGPHLRELLLYSILCLLHATEHWHLCVIDELWVRR